MRSTLTFHFPRRTGRSLPEAGLEQETGANSWSWVFLSRLSGSCPQPRAVLIPSLHCGANARGASTTELHVSLVASRLLRHEMFILLSDNLSASLDSPWAPIKVWSHEWVCIFILLSLPAISLLGRKIGGGGGLSYADFAHPINFLCFQTPSCQKAHLLATQTLHLAAQVYVRSGQLWGR